MTKKMSSLCSLVEVYKTSIPPSSGQSSWWWMQQRLAKRSKTRPHDTTIQRIAINFVCVFARVQTEKRLSKHVGWIPPRRRHHPARETPDTPVGAPHTTLASLSHSQRFWWHSLQNWKSRRDNRTNVQGGKIRRSREQNIDLQEREWVLKLMCTVWRITR